MQSLQNLKLLQKHVDEHKIKNIDSRIESTKEMIDLEQQKVPLLKEVKGKLLNSSKLVRLTFVVVPTNAQE